MKKTHEAAIAKFKEMLESAPEGCHPAMMAVVFFKEEGEDIMTGTDVFWDERMTPMAIKHCQEVLKRRISNINNPKPVN